MLEEALFRITTQQQFESVALEVFQYQYSHVESYRTFCNLLKKAPQNVRHIEDIPYLPIQLFKTHRIISEEKTPRLTFTSSGTTGTVPSTHFVAEPQLYEKSFLRTFQQHYGAPSDWAILALLPSYLQREGSSLVYMANTLIEKSSHAASGFYLHNLEALSETLLQLEAQRQPTILMGVSYALLDLIALQPFQLRHTLVMETGGMKGRRPEMIKEALHEQLKKGLGVSEIHSEYGMTELLSQAYSKGDGLFQCPPWMRVSTRDPEDVFTKVVGKTGGINVIDLANLYSCSFIATQDLGKVDAHGNFKILGRFDHSDIRGCNLMVL